MTGTIASIKVICMSIVDKGERNEDRFREYP
jgi:hypothetical protein